MSGVRAACLAEPGLANVRDTIAPALAQIWAASAGAFAMTVQPGFVEEVSQGWQWLDEQPLRRLPELARAAGGTATNPAEALAFIDELGIDRWVELVRSQRDLDMLAQSEASRAHRAMRAGAWRARSAAPGADAHEARKHRVVCRLAAWLHAAGSPAAGEAQFSELRVTLLALSKAQLEGVWSELSLWTVAQDARPLSALGAWERFSHASAIIIGVAGHGRALRWPTAPSSDAGGAVIAEDVHLVVDGPASASNPTPTPPADPRIVEPEGGSWPHRDKADWADAEKVALQEMRDRGMTDAQLAAVAGCSRQRVGQLIGSKIAAKSAAVTRAKLAGRG